MPIHRENYERILGELNGKAQLVAVSKTKPVEEIRALYDLGQRDFGENYVQELTEKQAVLPAGIRWHFIGHLQSNKVRSIAPFVHLIHGIDSLKLLREVHKEGARIQRVIPCLLQVHIATEETKFGFDESELPDPRILQEWPFARVQGLMGMASFSSDTDQVRNEFRHLHRIFEHQRPQFPEGQFQTLSMGMSGDYTLALEEGSTMVRIGSLLFGERQKAG